MSGDRRLIMALLSAVAVVAAVAFFRPKSSALEADKNGIFHVFAGGDIQAALDAAAANSGSKRVQVHAGEYRPRRYGQALIWFNAVHDGITLEAVGDVILTAANPEVAAKTDAAYPAVVNHVVYFG